MRLSFLLLCPITPTKYGIKPGLKKSQKHTPDTKNWAREDSSKFNTFCNFH